MHRWPAAEPEDKSCILFKTMKTFLLFSLERNNGMPKKAHFSCCNKALAVHRGSLSLLRKPHPTLEAGIENNPCRRLL